jgi:hypothetical protein
MLHAEADIRATLISGSSDNYGGEALQQQQFQY